MNNKDEIIFADDSKKMQFLKDIQSKEDKKYDLSEIERIIESMSSEYIFKVISNKALVERLGITMHSIRAFTTDLKKDEHKKIILEMYKFFEFDSVKIIKSMSNSYIINELISNKKLMDELGIDNYDIKEFIPKLEKDEDKKRIMDMYNLSLRDNIAIIKSFSCESKIKIIMDDELQLGNKNIVDIISSINADEKVQFIKQNRPYLEKKNIPVYEIIRNSDPKSQLEFMEVIDKLDLTQSEKKCIIVCLSDEAKKEIDKSNLDAETIELLEFKCVNSAGRSQKRKIYSRFK